MCALDDRILEYLHEEGWQSPQMMAQRDEFEDASQARINERCERLAHAGLIAPLWSDCFELTGEGERYLDGEFDADWLLF